MKKIGLVKDHLLRKMKFDLNNFKSFVLFDLETNGLNLRLSLPWEIAWIHFDKKGIISESQYYIRWDNIHVSEEIKKLTGFNKDEYEKLAVSPSLVWEKFSKLYLDDSIGIIGHNILSYDFNILSNMLREIKVFYPWKPVLNRYIDTHLISKALKLGMEIDKDNFLCWQHKVSNIKAKIKTKLQILCEEEGITWDESKSHRGLYDCQKNVEFFNKRIKFKLY